MFKHILKKCSEGKTMTQLEARQLMDEMMMGHGNDVQLSALLSMMRLRGETVEEMLGFAMSMRDHAIQINHSEKKLIDTCGTGGDHLNTFNISTTTAIALSACNVKVAKHGNRAISSSSGSADVLEVLKIPIQTSPIEAVHALEQKGLCFLFAPIYHQSMKHVANTRKLLGFKTIFNLLGPLVNPARANIQMIGVFDTAFAEKMAKTLRHLGTKRALFVTGGEGIDECSITTYTDVVELKEGNIERYRITPEQFGLKRGNLSEIEAKSVQESAVILRNIFNGSANQTAFNIVLLNTAAALYIADEAETIVEGIAVAKELFSSGKAHNQFCSLQEEELRC